ncbi:energy transducer TonB [Thalassotalea sp. 1_MG-2023]|uniref:energy transducer TonB n=1 Tax=Thalassotalea sp. 1_MG-2023 TaxID=3062680 RepID=UPI0026E48759|nr:energy transducer TonB [Thalassotalea sp. 1_MG-2023]MDO6427441.1 energy transducer TonB [Thalassotalea sp. 1_MG-2023]
MKNLILCLALTIFSLSAIASSSYPKECNDFTLKVKPMWIPKMPKYPEKALKSGVEGCVVLTFTITSHGSVKNVTVVNEYPKGKGFAEEAKKAMSRTKYKPLVKNGEPLIQENVQYQFSFRDGIVHKSE